VATRAAITRPLNECRPFPGLRFETGGTQGSADVEFAFAEFILAFGTSTALHTVLSSTGGSGFGVSHPFARKKAKGWGTED
jgi:hypothetical protein